MNLLFVCTENRLRSATAEVVFTEFDGIDAIGAGTNRDAVTPLSGDLVEWADCIFVMEQVHHAKLTQQYAPLLRDKRVVCLDIPDKYRYMQPELVKLLSNRVQSILGI